MALSPELREQLINELADDPAFQQASPAQQVDLFKQRATALEQSGARHRLDPTKTPNPQSVSIQQGYAPAPTFAQELTAFASRDVPEIAAATAGGYEGARYGAQLPVPPQLRPLTTFGGGLVGAGLALAGTRKAYRTLTEDHMPSTEETIADTQRAFGETLAGESLGGGLRLLGKGYQTGKRYLTAGRAATPGELDTFEKGRSVGVHLRPADVTASPAALRTEQTIRGTQAGADIFKARDLSNQENFLRAYEREVLDTVATRVTPEARGQLIKDVIEQRAVPEYQEMARRAYDELRIMTQGEKLVVPKESLELAKELAGSVTAKTYPKASGIINKVLDQVGQAGPTTGMTVKRANTAEGTVAGAQGRSPHLHVETKSEAPSIPRPLDFMEAHDIRSMLGELGSTGETLPKKAQGIANTLWSMMGLEMEQGAITFQQRTGIPLSRKWAQADQLVKEQGHALFDANVISRMLKANPEDVVKEVLKPDGLTEMRTVVQALGRIKDEPGLEQLRRGVLEKLWQDGVVKRGSRLGEFSGSQFAEAVHGYGDETLKIALGPTYGRFQKFVEIAKHMDPKSTSGMGMSLVDKGVLITAPLAGVGGSILQHSVYPIVAAATTVGTWLISTRHLAQILNDPHKAGALLRVSKTSPGTEAWTRAVGELLSVETGERMVAPMLTPLNPPTLQPAPAQP